MSDWYSALTVDSPIAVKRFSHRRRFRKAIDLLAIEPSDHVLDCGAGDGYLVRALAERPCAELVAYEPVADRFDDLCAGLAAMPAIRVVSSMDALHPNGYDKIACLEVLEHLTTDEQDAVMSDIHRLLSPRGRVVISVPVETGPASLLKNLVRVAFRQTHGDTTAMNVARSALGLKIERRSYTGHIGFDHRRLPPLFERHGFAIVKRATSPFAWGGAALATQLFFVLRKRSGPEALEFVSL